MFLATTEGTSSSENVGQSASSSLKNIEDSIKNIKENVIGPDLKNAFQNIEKTLIGMSDAGLALQRSMGGVLSNTTNFQKKLQDAYFNTVQIGGTFKDATEAVQSLADGMGKIVNPASSTVQSMVELSKASGLSTKEIGTMVTEMVRFGGTQDEAISKISAMAKEARTAGLNGKNFTAEISKNYKNISGFGFKSGVDGLKNMVKQSMLLRTNIESIGALKLRDSVLDPEGAIEAAANFQMLGGAIGGLGDPFQLLYMAQTNVEGLQEELVKSTKSAFSFNKETGNFDIATQDMYRLREQAKITGTNLEDLVNAGREASKLDFIKEKFDLDGMDESTQGLIASLGTIGEGGKLTVDIPGIGKPIVAENPEQLKAALATEESQKALADYQRNQDKTDRQLAEASLTIQERQSATQNEIKNAVLASLDDTQMTDFINSTKQTNKNIQEGVSTQVSSLANKVDNFYVDTSKVQEEAAKTFAVSVPQSIQDILDAPNRTSPIGTTQTSPNITTMPDGLIPSNNSAPLILSKGAFYKGIVGDDVAMGVGLGDAISKVTSGNVGGTIDININLNGSINGDPGQISQMFNSPQIQKQIMDTVLYKLNDYKRQQGVLS